MTSIFDHYAGHKSVGRGRGGEKRATTIGAVTHLSLLLFQMTGDYCFQVKVPSTSTE